MNSPSQVLDDCCPRCGEAFHCAAANSHCDCFDLTLSAALRQALARQYSACLCISCLKQLQAQANALSALQAHQD
jgi:hypothetical protein